VGNFEFAGVGPDAPTVVRLVCFAENAASSEHFLEHESEITHDFMPFIMFRQKPKGVKPRGSDRQFQILRTQHQSLQSVNQTRSRR
jgi:hypothetical protein